MTTPFIRQQAVGDILIFRSYGQAPATAGQGRFYDTISLLENYIRFGFKPYGTAGGGPGPPGTLYYTNPMVCHVGHMMNR
jgi:hypothetical protein